MGDNNTPTNNATDTVVTPVPIESTKDKGRERTDDFLVNTLLAIRTAVTSSSESPNKLETTPDDFTATRKHRIVTDGNKKIEVKDYTPEIFCKIRNNFGVSTASYLQSWSDNRIAKSRSVGKSDSMFIHSPDNQFVLKTLSQSEAKQLYKIMKPYYELLTTHKDTFLSRIYGLHRMSRRRGKVYFAIFNNVFDSGPVLTEIYDLKGSTVGRTAGVQAPIPGKEIADTKPKKPTVLKDLDFTRKLHVGAENRAKILAQLAIDCKFLSQHHLMDYSMLIGISRLDAPLALHTDDVQISLEPSQQPIEPGSSTKSETSPFIPFHKTVAGGMKGNALGPLDPKECTELYYIGVIDFLQRFNIKKRFAGMFKSITHKKRELSTVAPVYYMERFLKMSEKAIEE